jgi:hypothetical protein
LVYVGQLADTANRLLKDRGSPEKLEPKALGWTIRSSLGLLPKRNAKGFAIRLTEDVRHRIHQLAWEHQVSVTEETVVKCSYCTKIFGVDGVNGKPKFGTTSAA